jgi:rod shape determining protein RodA
MIFISAKISSKISGKTNEKLSQLNWSIIYLILALAFVGFFMLYSAAGGSFRPWLIKQLMFFTIFFAAMILIAISDIKIWFRLAYYFYFIALLLIIAVDVMGHNALGATRWFKIGFLTIQPSEIMKVCMVLALARYFSQIETEDIPRIRSLIIPALLIFAPAFFIFSQPDFGTAAILVLVGISILFLAGVKIWKFIFAGIIGLITIPFVWFFLLYDYQKKRVLTFLDPSSDPLGSGYNIIQSKIAIGSGGIFGKGYLNGTQGQLNFLPEKQTDFIFTMLCEELGFIGSMSIILLYSAIIFIGIKMSLSIRNQYGKLVAIGIINIFFIHMFVNMAMVMGLIPVVGAPLPLISYGGTITATMLIGFGFLLNADLYKDAHLKS